MITYEVKNADEDYVINPNADTDYIIKSSNNFNLDIGDSDSELAKIIIYIENTKEDLFECEYGVVEDRVIYL